MSRYYTKTEREQYLTEYRASGKTQKEFSITPQRQRFFHSRSQKNINDYSPFFSSFSAYS